MAVEPIEIFAVGDWTDSNNVTRHFSSDVLSEIAESYDTTIHRAPIVVNHDEKSPNEGIVSRLFMRGQKLLALPGQVVEGFAESVNSGRWPSVSSGLYAPDDPNNPIPGKWGLRHLSFVQVPAVKGLAAPAFSEATYVPYIEILYSEASVVIVNEPPQQKESEVKTSPATQDTEKEGKTPPLATPSVPQAEALEFAEQKAALNLEMAQLKAARVEFAEQQQTEKDALAAAKKELEASKAQFEADAAAERKLVKDVAFCDGLVSAGQLTRANYDRVLAVLSGPPQNSEICFSDPVSGDLSWDALLQSTLTTMLPVVVDFGERSRSTGNDATGGAAAMTGRKLQSTARKMISDARSAGDFSLTYDQAVNQLTKGK